MTRTYKVHVTQISNEREIFKSEKSKQTKDGEIKSNIEIKPYLGFGIIVFGILNFVFQNSTFKFN